MKRMSLLMILAAVGGFCAGAAGSSVDREALGQLVREYLLKNPAVVREALEALRVQDEKAAAELTRETIAKEREALFNDREAPFLGSADADVTLVEFFDYRCGYCKQMAPVLQKLIDSDPKVRVVLKELPILGPPSEFAAKAALAARSKGKYVELHRALMSGSPAVSEAEVRAAARNAGIEQSVLAGMNSPAVGEALRANAALADRLSIRGTPGLIVGDRLLPGAVSYEGLKELVAAERARRSK